MARRTLGIFLLPVVRFLAIVNAAFGLLVYEERNGRMDSHVAKDVEEFLSPARHSDQSPAFLPAEARIHAPRSAGAESVSRVRELVEAELPEGSVFHVALSRPAKERRKKKIVWTPFGEFTISFLDLPFGAAAMV